MLNFIKSPSAEQQKRNEVLFTNELKKLFTIFKKTKEYKRQKVEGRIISLWKSYFESLPDIRLGNNLTLPIMTYIDPNEPIYQKSDSLDIFDLLNKTNGRIVPFKHLNKGAIWDKINKFIDWSQYILLKGGYLTGQDEQSMKNIIFYQVMALIYKNFYVGDLYIDTMYIWNRIDQNFISLNIAALKRPKLMKNAPLYKGVLRNQISHLSSVKREESAVSLIKKIAEHYKSKDIPLYFDTLNKQFLAGVKEEKDPVLRIFSDGIAYHTLQKYIKAAGVELAKRNRWRARVQETDQPEVQETVPESPQEPIVDLVAPKPKAEDFNIHNFIA